MPAAKREAVALVASAAQGVRRDALVWILMRVVGFAGLTALAAQVCIPAGRVPITFQTLAVFVTGFWLRPREAAGAMFLYLTVGAAGAPVFSAGSCGLGGLTAGYLLGFVPAAWLISLLAYNRSDCLGRLVLAAGLGLALIYATGLAWLSSFPGGWSQAVTDGFIAFLGIDALKVGVAVTVITARPRRVSTAEDKSES